MDSLPELVKQIPEVDYLNLFVSALRYVLLFSVMGRIKDLHHSENDCSYELFKDLRRDATVKYVHAQLFWADDPQS